MDKELKSYPVLSRLRHDGVLYTPEGDRNEVELTQVQATTLLALKVIGKAPDDEGTTFDLTARLRELIAADHPIVDLNMVEIGKLLGKNKRGVTREMIDDALETITSTPAK
ncbi:MAG: hypothetical protein V7695_18485 [Sulfitobacter sp.]